MYGYIYLTTNLKNNKKYIGQHASPVFDKRYKGSGTILKQAMLKDGRQNFTCEILQTCESKAELNECERYFIEKYNAVEDSSFYNIMPGGDGVPKGTPSPKKGKPNPASQIPCSPEKKEKIRQEALGRYRNHVWIHKPGTWENKHVPKADLELYLSFGYVVGRDDPETFAKIRSSLLKHPSMGMLGKTQSKATREKQSQARRGIKYSEETRERIKLGKLNKILVSNEELDDSLYIEKEQLSTYEAKGYHRGRKKK